MMGVQNKELHFVVIDNEQLGCSWFASTTRLERQINLAIISIKMMVHVVFTGDVCKR